MYYTTILYYLKNNHIINLFSRYPDLSFYTARFALSLAISSKFPSKSLFWVYRELNLTALFSARNWSTEISNVVVGINQSTPSEHGGVVRLPWYLNFGTRGDVNRDIAGDKSSGGSEMADDRETLGVRLDVMGPMNPVPDPVVSSNNTVKTRRAV